MAAKVMKAIKNKSLSKLTPSKMALNSHKKNLKAKAAAKAAHEVDESKVMKRQAAILEHANAEHKKNLKARTAAKAAQEVEEPKVMKRQVQATEAPAVQEEGIIAKRRKELKSMPVTDLKATLESKGLPIGKKGDMIVSLLKAEAKLRAEARAHDAKIKAVVNEFKHEFESKSNAELKELCSAKGLKIGGGKDEKVERLLEHAKQEGAIEKVMVGNARNARRAQLSALDKQTLLKYCEKAKIDPCVKEVMSERLFSHEVATGALGLQKAEVGTATADKAKLQKKTKAFKAMATEDLKKLSQEKGLQSGNKDDMVEALVFHEARSAVQALRRKELKAMGKDGLKELVASKGLEANSKEAMVDTILAQEAKQSTVAREQALMRVDIEKKKKGEFSQQTNPELKDMCTAKGLKSSGGKDEKVERLMEAARADGEIDQVLLSLARTARRTELDQMEKQALKVLCDRAGLDTLIKEVMVERIISSEFDVMGQTAPKKQRTA